MPISKADILNLQSAYIRQGLRERRSRLEKLPDSFNQFRGDLEQALDHIDNLTRIDLKTQLKPGTLVRGAFRSYNMAIKDLDRLSRDTVKLDLQNMDLFARTGRYLYDEVEPLLSDDKKTQWRKGLQTFHKSIARVNYPEWVCSLPILGTGSRCPEVLARIVKKPSFQKAFVKRMVLKLKNLLPPIFDSGFSLPKRIELGCESGRCQTNFVYDKLNGPRVPNREFQDKFQAQFIDDMHHIIEDLLKKTNQRIDIKKALDEGWFQAQMTAFSEESREADSKRAQIIESKLMTDQLDNLCERLRSIGSGVELEMPAYLSCNLLLGLFRTIDAELRGWLGDLKEGILHPDEFDNHTLKIKRASLMLKDCIDNYSKVEPEFQTILEHYKSINERISQLIEPYLPSRQKDTQDLSMNTFNRLMAFYRQEAVTVSDDYDQESTNDQLRDLLNYEEPVHKNEQLLFESAFANAFHLIIQNLLVSINPLDFRALGGLTAKIQVATKGGNNYPRIVLSSGFINNDEQYAQYFDRKYDDIIDTAIDEANDTLNESLNRMFNLDWNQLEAESCLNLGLVFDLSNFSRGEYYTQPHDN